MRWTFKDMVVFMLIGGLCLMSSIVQSQTSSSLTTSGPARRALIIAISNYAPWTGWSNLNAHKDAALLKEVLQRQLFKEENMVLLADSQATYRGIISAVNLLIAQSYPGDIVFFHFSGHGQQILDDDGDEVDGYDEALIPYDAGMHYRPGIYQGEHHLRDDLIGKMLDSLRQKLGPTGSLMVSLDACHSGTATRGMGIIRGTADPLQPPETPIPSKPYGSMRSADKETFGIANVATEAAPMMVISASAPHENNYEMLLKDGTSVGSLTWILARSLERTPPGSTNQALFHQIRLTFARLHPFQQPQCEGETDHLLFSGEVVSRPPHFYVIHQPNDTTLTLNGGALAGLNEGAIVGFFPPDTRNPFNIKPLIKGVVASALPMTATIQTLTPFHRATARGAWAYVLQPAYPPLSVDLEIKLPSLHPLRDQFMSTHPQYPFVKVVTENPQVSMFIDPHTTLVQLMTYAGNLLPVEPCHADSINPATISSIFETLRAYAMAEYVRNMETESPALETSLRIIPIPATSSQNTTEAHSHAAGAPSDALPVFHPGDLFSIEVTNRGSAPIWFNLIDIQPDNQISVILPSTKPVTITIHDLRLEPGAKYRTIPFVVNPPFGIETIKCISTAIPVDLSLAFLPPHQRPVRRSAPNHPLDAVLTGTTPPNSSALRGATPNTTTATHIQTLHFVIQPSNQE